MSTGGGGGGGRTARHLEGEAFSFTGNVLAQGGNANNANYRGSPGTVYIQSQIGTADAGQSIHRQLWLNGAGYSGLNTCTYATILGEDEPSYAFDIVDLRERACLELEEVRGFTTII